VKIRELRQEYKTGRGGTPGTCFHTHFDTSTYVLSCTQLTKPWKAGLLERLYGSIQSRVRAFMHERAVISYTKGTCIEAQLVRAFMHTTKAFYVLWYTNWLVNQLILHHFSWINFCLKTNKNYNNKPKSFGAVLFLKVGDQTT
jgi:hypothetical protein